MPLVEIRVLSGHSTATAGRKKEPFQTMTRTTAPKDLVSVLQVLI